MITLLKRSIFIFLLIFLAFFLSLNLMAEEYPIALTHIDTLSVYCGKTKSERVEVDFLSKNGPLILSTAIWIGRWINSPADGVKYVEEIINCSLKKFEGNDKIVIVNSAEDIKKAIKEKKIAIIFTLEGGEPIEDLENIERIQKLGIKAVSLTWSRDNSLACAHNTNNDTGLSKKGERAVKLLNKNKIMIDVSHASSKTIDDILRISDAPVYASHSNARDICNVNRNLTDRQIKEIALKGGIIGINFHSPHTSCNSKSNVDDIYRHIKHIKEIAGVKAIAIGSDFDGHIKSPDDIKGLDDIPVLIKKLRSENWTEEEIRDILYRNFMEFFERARGNLN